MRIALVIIIIAALMGIAYVGFVKSQSGWNISDDSTVEVLVAYNKDLEKDYGYVVDAFMSVLEEEGVPHDKIEIRKIFQADPLYFAKVKPVILFPDGVNQIIPLDIRNWMFQYMHHGGSIGLFYDPATKDRKGNYLKESLFASISGINYVTYDQNREESYTTGNFRIPFQSLRDYLEIPFGKVDENGNLTGYIFGALEYPMAKVELTESLGDCEFYSEVIDKNGNTFPGVVVRKFEKGKVLYVNMPVGHIKAYSDDLPMRSILRAFLFKDVEIPHLLNVPDGKPGVIWNWHIDDRSDWESIPYLIENDFLKEKLDYSIHITAGPYLDDPDDNFGFDACGEGIKFTQMLMRYGTIGSHGGWAHNWFADQSIAKLMTDEKLREVIVQNNECLESVTSEKVLEYSAPSGAFKQPVTNEILADLGCISYYNTADTGSAPNRNFVNGKMATDKAISFPIMPFRKAASFYEMSNMYMMSPEQISEWLNETINYVVRNRTVRLMYSHPYDIYTYLDDENKNVIKDFFNKTVKMVEKGEINFRPMSFFAKFMLRFLKTEYSFTSSKDALHVKLSNGESLDGITVALPKSRYVLEDKDSYKILEDEYYYLIVIENESDENITEKTFKVNYR